ncbi:MAG: hypothetical protein RBT05_07600 [Bacteroidales bacterium]|jgi:hypothetical protein|nr:hypothetical protein [Bacteroidales bacterium]
MAKGIYLTREIRRMVSKIYKDHPRYGPTETRKELHEQMAKLGLDEKYEPNWPSISAVSKLLKEYRERDEQRPIESQELDEPWSFSKLARYPIPPESMPILISIHEKCFLEFCLLGCDSEEWFLTTREALWIVRLHKIIEYYKSLHVLPDVRDEIMHRIIHATDEERKILDELEKKNMATNWHLASMWGIKGEEMPIEDTILDWASTFASYEETCEIEGQPFVSTEYQLDQDMMRNIYDRCGDRLEELYEPIAEEYGVDEMKLREKRHYRIGDIFESALRMSSLSGTVRSNYESTLNEYLDKYYRRESLEKL